MFGFGEKHTRNTFKRAEQERGLANKQAWDTELPYHGPLGVTARVEKAKRKIESLKGKAEKEGHNLNEEYDRLLANFEAARKDAQFQEEILKAHDDLEDFEMEKLGMPRDEGRRAELQEQLKQHFRSPKEV